MGTVRKWRRSLRFLRRLGSRFERTVYQDPRSPINQDFRGSAGIWPYAGGAVAIGFRYPEDGPTLPTVPDNDPHRTDPPEWLSEPR